MTPRRDMTRWNRAALSRFRYVDGNAASWLEELRLAHLVSFLQSLPRVEMAGIDWWRDLFADLPEDPAELAEVFQRIDHTQRPVLNEGKTTCCYAKSEKNWVEDPQGVQWETFLTTGESTLYGHDAVEGVGAKPCCGPANAA